MAVKVKTVTKSNDEFKPEKPVVTKPDVTPLYLEDKVDPKPRPDMEQGKPVSRFKIYFILLMNEIGIKLWNVLLVILLAISTVIYTIIFLLTIIPDYLLSFFRFINLWLEKRLIDVIRLKLQI